MNITKNQLKSREYPVIEPSALNDKQARAIAQLLYHIITEHKNDNRKDVA